MKAKSETDLLFVIDATGSMSSTIYAAHDKAVEIAIQLKIKYPNTNFRFGAICFRDPVDSKIDKHEIHQMSSSVDDLVDFLSNVTATGGKDEPEDWVGAMKLATEDIKWRNGSRMMIIISDAPAHGARFCGYQNHQEQESLLPIYIKTLARMNILVTGLSINGGADLTLRECIDIYANTNGPSFKMESFNLDHIVEKPKYAPAMSFCRMSRPEKISRVTVKSRRDTNAEQIIGSKIIDAAYDLCSRSKKLSNG